MKTPLRSTLSYLLIAASLVGPLPAFARATVIQTDLSSEQACDFDPSNFTMCVQYVKGQVTLVAAPASNPNLNTNIITKSTIIWTQKDLNNNVQVTSHAYNERVLFKHGEPQIARVFSEFQTTLNGVCTQYVVEHDFTYNGKVSLTNPSWSKTGC